MNALRILLVGLPIAVVSTIVAACGPGSNNPVVGITTPAPVPTATPTAPAVPTVAPFTSATTAPVTAGTAISLSGASAPAGVTASLTLPAGVSVPAGTTVGSTLTNTAPAGIPAISSVLRTTAAVSTLSEQAPITVILFDSLNFTTSASFTIPAGLSFTFGLPSNVLTVPGVAFYVALYDTTRAGAGWQSRFLTCTTGTSSVTCTSSAALTIFPGAVYWFGLYAVSTAAASPTPGPSPTAAASNASPSPSPAASASPSPSPAGSPVTVTPGTTATNLTLPLVGGIGGTLQIPGLTGGSAITGFGSATGTDRGLPALTGTDVKSVAYYGSFTTSGALTVPGGATATFTGVPSGGLYYLAVYDGSNATAGWVLRAGGPGTNNAGGLFFSLPQGAALKASTQYGFALYASNSAAPAATFTASASQQAVNLPTLSANGVSGTVTVPAATSGVGNTVTIGLTTNAISNGTLGSIGNVLAVYSVTAASTTVIGSGASAVLSVPTAAIPSGSSVYVAILDPTSNLGWSLAAVGPATVTADSNGNSSVAFNIGKAVGPAVLIGGTSYQVLVYTQVGTNVTPTSGTGTLSATAASSVTLPASGGFSGTVSVANSSAASALSLSGTNQLPVGLPAATFNAPYYVQVTPATSTNLGGAVSVTLTLPAGTIASSTDRWWLSVLNGAQLSSGWSLDVAGPAGISGNTLTFSGIQPLGLTAGVTYTIALNRF